MLRVLILLLTLTFLPVCAVAEPPLTHDGFTSDTYIWPEGAAEAEADFVYRYSYPHFVENSAPAQAVNLEFQSAIDYAVDFEWPMYSERSPLGQRQVNVLSEITHLSDEILSVRITKEVTIGAASTNKVSALTFSLTGSQAGSTTSLPYLLGLLDEGANDEWYIQRQTAKADKCVKELVWALIEQDMKRPDSMIYDDMTFEEFGDYFFPEEEFYLDEDGNFVFFILSGYIAPKDAGHFFYTFTLDELLDEI